MRCLRQSLYASPAPPLMTTVVRDCDVIDSLESIALQMVEGSAKEGGLVLDEIFEMPNGSSIAEVTMVGMRRLGKRELKEVDQALLYYWAIHEWRLLKAGGTMMMDKPAPLSREEIVPVLAQLAMHQDYHDFTIISTDETGALVTLANGRVKEGA